MPAYVIQSYHNTILPNLPPFGQPGFFFNEPAHLQQQGGSWHQIVAVNTVTGLVDGRCAFFRRGQQAISPLAAPFGSVEFAPALPDAALASLIQQLIDSAKAAGATSLRLVNHPDCYAPDQAHRLSHQLHEHGFRTAATYENSHLTITGQPFEQSINPAEQRRLRKCRVTGFRFSHGSCPDLSLVIAFICRVRQQRSHTLTIEPDRLSQLIQTFPDRFPVVGVWDADQLIALAITVRISPDILYYFLPVSDPAYDAYSPMVLLIDGLWQYCQQQRIGLLDLGVSLDGDRTPKSSLLQFKRNLGAQTSAKTVFERAL